MEKKWAALFERNTQNLKPSRSKLYIPYTLNIIDFCFVVDENDMRDAFESMCNMCDIPTQSLIFHQVYNAYRHGWPDITLAPVVARLLVDKSPSYNARKNMLRATNVHTPTPRGVSSFIRTLVTTFFLLLAAPASASDISINTPSYDEGVAVLASRAHVESNNSVETIVLSQSMAALIVDEGEEEVHEKMQTISELVYGPVSPWAVLATTIGIATLKVMVKRYKKYDLPMYRTMKRIIIPTVLCALLHNPPELLHLDILESATNHQVRCTCELLTGGIVHTPMQSVLSFSVLVLSNLLDVMIMFTTMPVYDGEIGECKSITPHLVERCEECDGKLCAITYTPIETGNGVCVDNLCYSAPTMSRVMSQRGVDPYTQRPFTEKEFDYIQEWVKTKKVSNSWFHWCLENMWDLTKLKQSRIFPHKALSRAKHESNEMQDIATLNGSNFQEYFYRRVTMIGITIRHLRATPGKRHYRLAARLLVETMQIVDILYQRPTLIPGVFLAACTATTLGRA